MNKVLETPKKCDVEMRAAFSNSLSELVREGEKIIIIDTDCSNSMGTKEFAKSFPENHLNIGIQEANAVSVAAGLSAEGFIPFVNGFSTFTSRRAYDQIFISCGYSGLNVKIVGWDAGISATSNGGTHMPFEDVGIIRNIPNMTLIEPADTVAFSSLAKKAALHQGNVYIRTLRKDVLNVYEEGKEFIIGKAEVINEGDDLTIITGGMMVARSFLAAKILKEMGYSVRVVDMHTIKPMDENCVMESARKTGAILTVENANVVGGINSAVCSYLSQNYPVPVERVGIEDRYGEVGDLDYLTKTFHLSENDIVQKALKLIKRKKVM